MCDLVRERFAYELQLIYRDGIYVNDELILNGFELSGKEEETALKFQL